MPLLAVGAQAPDFELDGSTGKVRLSDLLKQTDFVILAFFPASFSPVCTNELNLYQEVKDEFARLGAQVVGISVDGRYTQQAFAKANGITFPILADFHPKGAVARQYRVMREDGTAERALYLIDRKQTIRYSYLSETRENPGADRLFDALEAMQGERG
jgi:peroxiredoxin